MKKCEMEVCYFWVVKEQESLANKNTELWLCGHWTLSTILENEIASFLPELILSIVAQSCTVPLSLNSPLLLSMFSMLSIVVATVYDDIVEIDHCRQH